MEHWLVCKTHNKREISYIVLEELVSHIAFFLSYPVIFFDFTTPLLVTESPVTLPSTSALLINEVQPSTQ
jgi:hypothetical protein